MSWFLGRHLRGILDSPMGVDVYFGSLCVRGLLTREERQQDDGNGFTTNVFVTALTLHADDLPALTVDSRLEVGPPRARWNVEPNREACTVYAVRRIGRPDDAGARELLLAEVAR